MCPAQAPGAAAPSEGAWLRMDYYEEFGVSPDASPDQIRQAHKRLARLLHPDRFQDPELRRLAECQMKRLNAIYAVLADPERRREYDQARGQRAAGAPPPLPPTDAPAFPSRRPNFVWILAAAACAFALYWAFRSAPARAPQPAVFAPFSPSRLDEPRPAAGNQESKAQKRRPPGAGAAGGAPAPAVTDGEAIDELRRALRQAEAQRDAALAQMAKMKQSASEPRRISEAPASTSEPEPPTLAAAAAPPAGPRLAGTWFYVPRSVDFASKDVYPPEYIDLTISEENGIVRGRYWARYRVPDRAISPEVFFRFQGEANESGLYSWTGRGGARGEVRLRLISDETLEVVWLASELGQQMGLGSGTAVLIRQKRAERY